MASTQRFARTAGDKAQLQRVLAMKHQQLFRAHNDRAQQAQLHREIEMVRGALLQHPQHSAGGSDAGTVRAQMQLLNTQMQMSAPTTARRLVAKEDGGHVVLQEGDQGLLEQVAQIRHAMAALDGLHVAGTFGDEEVVSMSHAKRVLHGVEMQAPRSLSTLGSLQKEWEGVMSEWSQGEIGATIPLSEALLEIPFVLETQDKVQHWLHTSPYVYAGGCTQIHLCIDPSRPIRMHTGAALAAGRQG